MDTSLAYRKLRNGEGLLTRIVEGEREPRDCLNNGGRALEPHSSRGLFSEGLWDGPAAVTLRLGSGTGL